MPATTIPPIISVCLFIPSVMPVPLAAVLLFEDVVLLFAAELLATFAVVVVVVAVGVAVVVIACPVFAASLAAFICVAIAAP